MLLSRALRRTGVCVLACALAASLAGCAGGAPDAGDDGAVVENDQATTPESEPSAGGVIAPGDIPRGREIAEGGGGPVQYTFREEWRRGLVDAQGWRAGAYLITAVGSYVNNEGVPSSWTLTFIDAPEPDAVLLLEIDPWGNVTETRELTGEDVAAHANEFSAAIPVEVIDSDAAVAAGVEALASAYDIAETSEPRLGLGYSDLDGTGPYWTYSVFYSPTAEYLSARIDALSGEAQLQ